MRDHHKGLLLALAGVSILSFDSLLVKLVNAAPWDLLFWRGALLAASMAAVLAIQRLRGAPPAGALLSPMTCLGGMAFAASMIFFVLALNNTQVASALVIINTAPFFAALIALVCLHEIVQRHTTVAIAVSTAGIWIIFEYEPAAGAMLGDVYALGSALGTASYLVVMRAAGGSNGASYLLVAGVVTAAAALVNGAEPMALPAASMIFMLLLGCVVVPGSSLCIARAPRYLPAAQTGLVMLLEILLGPLFVYLFLSEQPSGNDIAGGTLVLLTLVGHTLWELRQGTRPSAVHP